jgi:monoterpene epsilon-lactone hydrolase
VSLALAVTYELLRFRAVSTSTAELALETARTRVPAPATARMLRAAELRERTVRGRPVIDIVPPRPSGTRLVYLHGGCYLYPIQSAHWGILASLVEQSGVSITLPLYGLAPDHTVDGAYELLDALAGPGAWLAGDSAGGGLALGHAMRLRDAGTPATGVILISPWVDVTLENPAIPQLQRSDRMLATPGLVAAGRLWAGSHDPRSPLVSPLFGDLAGLPPVHVFQGGRDVLAADARLLVNGIRAAGGTAELEFVDKAFHDYPGAPWMPEARSALRRMGELLS